MLSRCAETLDALAFQLITYCVEKGMKKDLNNLNLLLIVRISLWGECMCRVNIIKAILAMVRGCL
jgi:hypothetical protein